LLVGCAGWNERRQSSGRVQCGRVVQRQLVSRIGMRREERAVSVRSSLLVLLAGELTQRWHFLHYKINGNFKYVMNNNNMTKDYILAVKNNNLANIFPILQN